MKQAVYEFPEFSRGLRVARILATKRRRRATRVKPSGAGLHGIRQWCGLHIGQA